MAGKSSDIEMAQMSWELENNIETIPSCDEIFRYDAEAHQAIVNARPWENDPHYFKNVQISALALLKMVMHARSGGRMEVLGLLIGKVSKNTMTVMDSFAVPVEGTETNVNAQAEGYEYMTAYMESAKQVGRLENAVGWYHSHPDYGCWLSGIDVSSQLLNQTFQEPFVAIVVDPVRTVSAGKVCLGAFRTYPKGFKPSNEESSEYQTIPFAKIEDFGVHSKQYYPLDVTYFKSDLDRKLLDTLWNKYWVNTLGSSGLLSKTEYTTGRIFDLSAKLKESAASVSNRSTFITTTTSTDLDPKGKRTEKRTENRTEDRLTQTIRDCSRASIELIQVFMSQMIKDKLFNTDKMKNNN